MIATREIAVTVVDGLIALPAAFSSLYLFFLTCLSGSKTAMLPRGRALRFDVIVPAHDEESVIARTVANLRQLAWPGDRFRVIVIADNCADATADCARSAGALVRERQDSELRGKGYALAFAFEASRQDGWADALVVVDADAEASSNLLEAFAARLEEGEQAIQAHYGVLNPMTSWRTRLITIAKAAFHIVRSRARERLGLSCGIRGNGWCVTQALLQRVPYRSYSLTEDLEYGIELGLAGVRVAYADEAHCDAEMVSQEHVARQQRQRWERGRFALIAERTAPLLRAGFSIPSKVCLDLAADLLVLPLSYVALNVALLLATAAVTYGIDGGSAWLWVAAACALCLIMYVGRGWQLSGVGWRGIADLARAPGFLVWKILLLARPAKKGVWVRTERERREP